MKAGNPADSPGSGRRIRLTGSDTVGIVMSEAHIASSEKRWEETAGPHHWGAGIMAEP